MTTLLIETLKQFKIFENSQEFIDILISQGSRLGISILRAIALLIIGRYAIKLIIKLIGILLNKYKLEESVKSFLISTINVLLIILLAISIIGTLGIQTTSFAAVLASIGVAVGMSLSGNLSNFAGGLIILIFKPFKVGDYITNASVEGTVKQILISHTVLYSSDNIRVYVPNGALSSGYINNFTIRRRRLIFNIYLDLGVDVDKAKECIRRVVNKDDRVLKEPQKKIEINNIGKDGLEIIVIVWVLPANYFATKYALNDVMYKELLKENIEFTRDHTVIYQADEESKEIN